MTKHQVKSETIKANEKDNQNWRIPKVSVFIHSLIVALSAPSKDYKDLKHCLIPFAAL